MIPAPEIDFSMRLFKRKSGIYYVEVHRNVWRSLKTKDEREAKTRLRLLEREGLKEKLIVLDKSNSVYLKQFFAEYEKFTEDQKAFNTYVRLKRILSKALDCLGESRPLSSITSRDLDAYIEYCKARKNKPVTINIELRHLKAAMSEAVRWKYLKENPWAGYRQLKHQKRFPQFLSPEQVHKVFEAITDRKYCLIFALYVYTGARREEIHRLEWKHIKNGFVEIHKTKNYLPRYIPLHPRLEAILNEYGRGVGRIINVPLGQMAKSMKYYLRKAGLAHMRPHDLRHTFASQLVMAGVDLVTVSKLLGHTSIQTTMIYAHLNKEHLVEAVGKLSY